MPRVQIPKCNGIRSQKGSQSHYGYSEPDTSMLGTWALWVLEQWTNLENAGYLRTIGYFGPWTKPSGLPRGETKADGRVGGPGQDRHLRARWQLMQPFCGACMHIHTHICTYMYIYIRVYTYVYTHVYIYTYICICMHRQRNRCTVHIYTICIPNTHVWQ